MYIYQGKEYETLCDIWDAAQLAVELKVNDLIDISQVNWHELADVHVIPSADQS